MVSSGKDSLAAGFSRTQDKDFPYFRRLWNSVVVALLAASFIPLLIIGGGMYYYAVSVLEEKTIDGLRSEILDHREAIEAFLTERTMDLKLISSNLDPADLTSPGALEKVFHSLQGELPCFTDLGIIDDQGRHLAYVGPYDLLLKNYRDSPWFRSLRDQEVYISDVFLGFRNEPHFIIAVKQETDEGFWIIRATVDTAYFHDVVGEILHGRGGDSFLVNRDGIFQTSTRAAGQIMGQWELRNPEPFEGVQVKRRRDGIYLMAWLDKVPWLCVAKFDAQEVYRPLHNIRNLGIAIFGAGALIIVLTVFLTTNYLFGRLETKRRDIRFLDHQLRHSSKMSSSMRLASGFIRDIKDALSNIDAAVTRMGDLAHKDLSIEGQRQELDESLSQIKSEVGRARRTTETFLKTTRPSLPIINEVQVNDLLDEILELLDREIRFNRIDVKRNYQDPPPLIRSDPSQLRQVFQNLILNAVIAAGREGRITLTTNADAAGVRVLVADNGPGIPEGMRDKIFDPFYTARPDGTGLGLSIGARILQKLGGRISVRSEEGKGATFVVEVPSRFGASE